MKTNKKGFTLMELILSVTIVASVFLLAYGAISANFGMYAESSVYMEETQEIRTLMLMMDNDIRQSENVDSPATFILNVDDGQYAYNAIVGEVTYNNQLVADGIDSFIVREMDGMLYILIIGEKSNEYYTSAIYLER